MLNQELKALNELEEKIKSKRKLARRKSEISSNPERWEGYEQALLSVLIMISQAKEGENK